MKKIHKHDALLGVFFVVVVVGIFTYLFSNMLKNSRAAAIPPQLQEKINRCYDNHKVEECPSADVIKNSTDKQDKGCKMCYMRCNICVISERMTGKKCEVECFQADPTPLPTQAP